jgi:hypothetical protein
MRVAVLEHHRGGQFSMKATTPDYGEEGHVGAGASIGGLTGLMLGAIAGPLGILFCRSRVTHAGNVCA